MHSFHLADILLDQSTKPRFYNSLGHGVVVVQQNNAFDFAGLPEGVYLFTFEVDGLAGKRLVVKEYVLAGSFLT